VLFLLHGKNGFGLFEEDTWTRCLLILFEMVGCSVSLDFHIRLRTENLVSHL
jgi:hypothetical protein